MKQQLMKLAALICMFSVVTAVWSETTNVPTYEGCIAVTNSSASFVFLATATNGRIFTFVYPIGSVSSESMVSTNLAGLWVVLACPTNVFTLGSPTECRVFICNSSAAKLYLNRSDAYEDTTGFGKFVVTRFPSKELVPSRKLEPSRFGHNRGGGFGPGAKSLFEFDLNRLVEFSEPGEYRVVFRGKLPSTDNPEKNVDFETPALLLRVEAPDPK